MFPIILSCLNMRATEITIWASGVLASLLSGATTTTAAAATIVSVAASAYPVVVTVTTEHLQSRLFVAIFQEYTLSFFFLYKISVLQAQFKVLLFFLPKMLKYSHDYPKILEKNKTKKYTFLFINEKNYQITA